MVAHAQQRLDRLGLPRARAWGSVCRIRGTRKRHSVWQPSRHRRTRQGRIRRFGAAREWSRVYGRVHAVAQGRVSSRPHLDPQDDDSPHAATGTQVPRRHRSVRVPPLADQLGAEVRIAADSHAVAPWWYALNRLVRAQTPEIAETPRATAGGRYQFTRRHIQRGDVSRLRCLPWPAPILTPN